MDFRKEPGRNFYDDRRDSNFKSDNTDRPPPPQPPPPPPSGQPRKQRFVFGKSVDGPRSKLPRGRNATMPIGPIDRRAISAGDRSARNGFWPANGAADSDLIPSQFGPDPITVQCPFCLSVGSTEISLNRGSCVWMCFAVMLLSGFLLVVPFCFLWLPFVVKSWRDVEHRCGECHAHLGRFRR